MPRACIAASSAGSGVPQPRGSTAAPTRYPAAPRHGGPSHPRARPVALHERRGSGSAIARPSPGQFAQHRPPLPHHAARGFHLCLEIGVDRGQANPIGLLDRIQRIALRTPSFASNSLGRIIPTELPTWVSFNTDTARPPYWMAMLETTSVHLATPIAAIRCASVQENLPGIHDPPRVQRLLHRVHHGQCLRPVLALQELPLADPDAMFAAA
jgi:hypothetical protein